MFPSSDQIQRAAYDRWERRGRIHGADREDWLSARTDLIFSMNYRTIAEYSLACEDDQVLGDPTRPCCRFCELAPPRASFKGQALVFPDWIGNSSLFTAELCDECREQFASSIDAEFQRFWQSIDSDKAPENAAENALPIGAYKALIRMALTIMPRRELAEFTDTLEWVSNPDHEFDRGLFGDGGCLVYRVQQPYGLAWTSLAKRIEHDAPFPFLLFFLGSGKNMIQVPLPLCVQDDDLDGTEFQVLRRSFSTGEGAEFRPSRAIELTLLRGEQPRSRRFRLFA